MATNSATSDVLGTVGTILWCIQLLPQVYFNWRKKDCTGLPPIMLLLWSASSVPFFIYFELQRINIPLQVQPQIFGAVALFTFGQCLYYPPISMRLRKVLLIVLACMVVFAAIELACILPLIPVYDRGTTWPILIFGIIAAVLLAVGLLPPYYEIWKRNGRVVGINFIFLALDSSGALVSILSVVYENGSKDVLGMVLYVVVLVLELGIFACQGVYLIRKRFGWVNDKDEDNVEDDLETEVEDKALGVTPTIEC